MLKLHSRLRLSLAALFSLLPLLLPMDADAQSAGAQYKAETTRWRAAGNGFAAWQRDGVALAAEGMLRLDPQKARTGTDPYRAGRYRGGNFYNGGTFLVGEGIGPVVTPGFLFSEAVPSWNATTPPGSWVEVQLRARIGTQWTAWYNLGVWVSGQEGVVRHSVSGQADARAYVDVDTLKIGRRGKPSTAGAYQLKVRLFSTSRNALSSLENATVVVSTSPTAPTNLVPGDPARWNKLLDVPGCSQMVYPDGGEVWCSPTAVAMVLGYWAGGSGSCPAYVRAAVSGVYDRVYKGHGNWPFNTAYAASKGMEAYVTRFTSMAQAEEWIASGVPVIMSISWGRGQLAGAPIAASNGHLMVLVGFDAGGNPIVNDPAAATNESVRRTYKRAELEKLWLQGSGGTAYLIYPLGKMVPEP
ncbi:MAG: peptidase C39 family protein [Chloroflexia bacterium]